MTDRIRRVAKIGMLVLMAGLLSGCVVVEPGGHRHRWWFG